MWSLLAVAALLAPLQRDLAHPPLPPPAGSADELAVPPGPGAALGVLGRLESPLIDGRFPKAPHHHWSHWWTTERPDALHATLQEFRPLLEREVLEGTVAPRLIRLVHRAGDTRTRAAAVLALGRTAPRLDLGTRDEIVTEVAALLHDPKVSTIVRGSAALALGLEAGDRAIAELFDAGIEQTPLRCRIALALGIAASRRREDPGKLQEIALHLMGRCSARHAPEEHAASLAALGLVQLSLTPRVPPRGMRENELAPMVASRAGLARWLREHLSRGPAGRRGQAVVRAHGLVTLARVSSSARAGTAASAVLLLREIADPGAREPESIRAAAITALALMQNVESAFRQLEDAAEEGPALTRGLAAMALGRHAPARAEFPGRLRTWAALGRATTRGTEAGESLLGPVDPAQWTSGAGIALALGLPDGERWWTRDQAFQRATAELGDVALPGYAPSAGHAALACGLLGNRAAWRALDAGLRSSWFEPELLHGAGLGMIASGYDGLGKSLLGWLRDTEDGRVEAVLGELLGAGPGAEVLEELLELCRPKQARAPAVAALGLLAAGGDDSWRRTLWRGHPYFVELGALRGGDDAGPGLLDAP